MDDPVEDVGDRRMLIQIQREASVLVTLAGEPFDLSLVRVDNLAEVTAEHFALHQELELLDVVLELASRQKPFRRLNRQIQLFPLLVGGATDGSRRGLKPSSSDHSRIIGNR